MIRLALGALALLLALYVALFVAYALLQNPRPADMAVVCGNQVLADGMPSARLTARLAAAKSAYDRHLIGLILVSGARGSSGFDEAVVMRDTLVSWGVPASVILVDSAGRNTAATVANAVRLAHSRSLHSIMVVTQYFHVPRCLMAFRRAGVTSLSAIHPAFVEPRDVYSLARELVAFPVRFIHKP